MRPHLPLLQSYQFFSFTDSLPCNFTIRDGSSDSEKTIKPINPFCSKPLRVILSRVPKLENSPPNQNNKAWITLYCSTST
jgi:hypothetical protein